MCELSIKLEGLPEKVQRIADALEAAFPGMMDWVQSQDEPCGVTIKIEGFEVPAWADTINAQMVVRLGSADPERAAQLRRPNPPKDRRAV